jgi:rhodanese-related sulfurtransferase
MTLTPLRHISAPELADLLAAGTSAVIDVREPEEYASGHIAGSHNVPLGRLTESPLPDGPLVLVCQSGTRSGRGLEQLRSAGAGQALSDLAGGLPAWQEAGLPLERFAGAPLPLMRQVQITAGSLVLLGLTLATLVAPRLDPVELVCGCWAGVCRLQRLLRPGLAAGASALEPGLMRFPQLISSSTFASMVQSLMR